MSAPRTKQRPLPWRVGRRVPEHIYDADGKPIVTMPDARSAALVCIAVNHYEDATLLFNTYLGIEYGIEYRHGAGESVKTAEEEALKHNVEIWLGLRPRPVRAKRKG